MANAAYFKADGTYQVKYQAQRYLAGGGVLMTAGLAVLSTLPGVIAHISEELQHGRPIRTVPDGLMKASLDRVWAWRLRRCHPNWRRAPGWARTPTA